MSCSLRTEGFDWEALREELLVRATFFGDLAEKLTGLKVDEIVRQEKTAISQRDESRLCLVQAIKSSRRWKLGLQGLAIPDAEGGDMKKWCDCFQCGGSGYRQARHGLIAEASTPCVGLDVSLQRAEFCAPAGALLVGDKLRLREQFSCQNHANGNAVETILA